LCFTREACQTVRIEREPFGQHLHGDVAMQVRVAGAVHLAHRARTKRADDFVRTDAKTRVEERVRQHLVG
jgi:hypothetical protein